MCGFVGFLNHEPDTGANTAVIRQMAERIRHRGPDQDDYFVDNDISLGFRRLSIIDLSGGSQPILNEDGSMVLVFNGEIYNYQSLRKELLQKGHIFKTNTDSEVLLHGYEEYGADFTRRLRGMFAYLIWDKKSKTLFGARDIFGIKPFFYYDDGKTLLFASEIKAFLANPHFKKVYRLFENDTGKAIADLICVHDETIDPNEPLELFDPEATWKRKTITGFTVRELLVPIFRGGELVYRKPSIKEMRAWCAGQIDTLWDEVKRFENPHTYYVDLSQKLWDIKQQLLKQRE